MPSVISRQLVHSLHGISVGPFSQFRALANIRRYCCLSHAAGSAKDEGVGYAALMNGIPQGLHRMVLPHYLVKVLRSHLSG